MRKLYSLLIVLLFCGLCVSAQHRSESEAMRVAREFFGKKAAARSPKLATVPGQKLAAKMRSRAMSGKAAAKASGEGFYIINDEANNRFVIVSADERMYKILGYSDDGTFDEQNAPEGLLDLLGGYNKQYSLILKKPDLTKASVRTEKVEPIEPLIQTKWGQDAPFNNDCPEDKSSSDGSKCASGCVATAMAQVMNYYKYPAKGTGRHYYISDTNWYLQSFNFGNTTFDWDNLLDAYLDSAEAKSSQAEVAKLMHACGVSVSMDYGSSSGAAPEDIPYAMARYFGYNPNALYKKKDYYTDDEWNSLIMRELRAGRPILYGGRSEEGGHMFILDGCDEDGLYHFNFGQTGSYSFWFAGWCNGYYSLDAIKLEDGRLALIALLIGEDLDDLNFEDYTTDQHMVYQIYPTTIGNPEDVFYATLFSIGDDAISFGKTVECQLFMPNNYCSSQSKSDSSSPKFEGFIGTGLFDDHFNFIKSLDSTSVSRDMGLEIGIDYSHIVLSSGDLEEGKQYIIAPYARAKNHKRATRIRTLDGQGWYLVTLNGESVKLERNEYPVGIKSAAIAHPSVSYSGGTLSISASKAGPIRIYTTDGVLVRSINAKAGGSYQISLPEGVYVVNGRKFLFEK